MKIEFHKKSGRVNMNKVKQKSTKEKECRMRLQVEQAQVLTNKTGVALQVDQTVA